MFLQNYISKNKLFYFDVLLFIIVLIFSEKLKDLVWKSLNEIELIKDFVIFSIHI